MCESMESVLMSPEGTVAFLGFGEREKSYFLDEQTNDIEKEYEFLQKMRKEELAELNNEAIFANVSRENIYDDMIRLYRK